MKNKQYRTTIALLLIFVIQLSCGVSTGNLPTRVPVAEVPPGLPANSGSLPANDAPDLPPTATVESGEAIETAEPDPANSAVIVLPTAEPEGTAPAQVDIVGSGATAAPVFVEAPPYIGDCRQRPAGSTCVSFEDGYVWLIQDTIVGRGEDEVFEDQLVKVILGAGADYHHVLGTLLVKVVPNEE